MRHLCLIAVVLLGLGVKDAEADAVLAPGEPLTPAIVEALLREALAEQGADDALQLSVEGPRLPLANRSAQPTSLTLAEPRWDRRTRRWTATLMASLPTGESSAIPTWGRAEAMVEIMVPVRGIARGEVLSADDLEPRLVAEGAVAEDAVLATSAFSAGEARRALPRGRPIRERDLGSLRLVRRGEAVTMIYERAGMTLATLGEALDDAGLDQPLRVKNADSGEVRRGTAIGLRRVRLGLPTGAHP